VGIREGIPGANSWQSFHSDRLQLENGAFANYIVAKGDVQLKTPDNITDEEAATLGISITTVVSFATSEQTRNSC
jgi:NADPH:quinone reductase-like Zn-dependent oxidoreductase